MEKIYDVFSKVIGLYAWQVENGHGTFITMEFGAANFNVREPRVVKDPVSDKVRNLQQRRLITLSGDFHLFVQYCEWELKTKFVNATSQSHSEDIAYALKQLDGQILENVKLDKNQKKCYFYFDLDAVLITMPSKNIPDGDHWTLFYKTEQKNTSYTSDGEFETEFKA